MEVGGAGADGAFNKRRTDCVEQVLEAVEVIIQIQGPAGIGGLVSGGGGAGKSILVTSPGFRSKWYS